MLRVFIENIYIYFARALESSGWLDNSIAIKLNKINTIKKKTKEKKTPKVSQLLTLPHYTQQVLIKS